MLIRNSTGFAVW